MTDNDSYRVVLYARVSTDDKGQTNETQIREMKDYCKRMNWNIADNGTAIYTDEQTAKNTHRNGFRTLKGRITEGDIDYVVQRNQDRISREPNDYQDFIEYCKRFRVRLRFSDNPSQPETPEGVLIDSMMQGLAKQDNMKRSINTKKGMETARLNGIHCGRMLSFCWSDEVDQNRNRIQSVGEHRTAILNTDAVLDFARQGYTVNRAQAVIGISRLTLVKALQSKGIYEEYENLRKECKQRFLQSRDNLLGDNVQSRDQEVGFAK